jgi:general secretion pathway protein G
MYAIYNNVKTGKGSQAPCAPCTSTPKSAPKSPKKGFTLIEILIVVIILGILAAIVIPQFSSASKDARKSAMQSTVQTLRSQIALYKLQHGDVLPDLTASGGNNWTLLTTTSTGYNGQTVGPYMQQVPVNALTKGKIVKNGKYDPTGSTPVTAVAGCDYVYDYSSGNGSGNIWGTDDTTAGTIVPQ